MTRVNPLYAALLLSVALHGVLFASLPEFKGKGPRGERPEKVAIKYFTPVERKAPVPLPPTAPPKRGGERVDKPVYREEMPQPVTQSMPGVPAVYDQTPVAAAAAGVPEMVNTPAASAGGATRETAANLERLPEYLAVVRTTVESNKGYPAVAKRMGIEGSVVVRLTISADGYTQGIDLLVSSGNKHLDSAAIGAVRKSQPFQLPGHYGLSGITIDIPIVFRID
jgi:protein TonB